MNDVTPSSNRQPGSDSPIIRDGEETLVADSRAALTPSEIVEQKLIELLETSPLLVSQVQRELRPSPR